MGLRESISKARRPEVALCIANSILLGVNLVVSKVRFVFMDWLFNNSFGWLLWCLALPIELIGLLLVLVEALRPKRARYIERWFGQRVSPKPRVARLKSFFKFGERPDPNWLMFFFVALAFEEILVSPIRLLSFAFLLVFGIVVFRICCRLRCAIVRLAAEATEAAFQRSGRWWCRGPPSRCWHLAESLASSDRFSPAVDCLEHSSRMRKTNRTGSVSTHGQYYSGCVLKNRAKPVVSGV